MTLLQQERTPVRWTRGRLALAVAVPFVVAIAVGAWLAGRPPAEFTDRAALSSCGGGEAARGSTDVPPQILRCLNATLDAGAGAEAEVTARSAEGHPAVAYLRALPGGGVEIFTQNEDDPFGGPGGVTTRQCPTSRSITVLGGCGP